MSLAPFRLLCFDLNSSKYYPLAKEKYKLHPQVKINSAIHRHRHVPRLESAKRNRSRHPPPQKRPRWVTSTIRGKYYQWGTYTIRGKYYPWGTSTRWGPYPVVTWH